MEDSWPLGKPSELRLACEECHKRKIRCQAPRDGSQGICEACQVNQRQCLFSLKVKTGRPRKTDPDLKEDAGDGTHSSHTSSASPSGSTPDGIVVSPYQLPAGATPDVSSRQTSSYGPRANQQAGDYFAARSKRVRSRLPVLSLAVELETVPPGLWNVDQGADNVLLEKLEPGFALWPIASAHGSSGCSNVHTPGSLFLDNLCTSSTGLPDDWGGNEDDAQAAAAAAAGNGVDDFSEVMQLCFEIHQQCQVRPLDMLADADQGELALMFRTIEHLSRKVVEILARRMPAQSRQDQYQCTLLRVAVGEAIEITAELVRFNSRQMAGSAVKHTARVLEVVLSLCRLDHSLFHFGLFIASQNDDEKRHHDACRSAYPGFDAGKPCHCSGLTRMDEVKSQIWALVEKAAQLADVNGSLSN